MMETTPLHDKDHESRAEYVKICLVLHINQ